MELTTLIIIGIGAIISVIIYYLVTQWAHEVDARKHHMALQTEFLAKIAERQGVERNEIDRLLKREVAPNPIRINLYIILFMLFVVLAVVIWFSLKH
jgi:hypothetical protein